MRWFRRAKELALWIRILGCIVQSAQTLHSLLCPPFRFINHL